jgi:hypothetical protein
MTGQDNPYCDLPPEFWGKLEYYYWIRENWVPGWDPHVSWWTYDLTIGACFLRSLWR